MEVTFLKKLKVISVFGTRPEAAKMAPLINALKLEEDIESIVCVTAQHRQMLDQILDIFKIVPNYDLNIMKNKQSLSDITSAVLSGFQEVLIKEKPDLVLVHGDTSTTFASSLAAYYNQVKIGHVEAGLRTYDKYQPFPEEMNRKLTGGMTDLHFAPTLTAKENLLKENIEAKDIFITGNTIIDCIKYTIKENYCFNEATLNKLDYNNKKIITMTAHRRENLGEPLENICKAVLKIVKDNKDVEIVFPLHFNPLVRSTVQSILGNNKSIHLIEPVDMEDMHNLMNKSYLILTDSGGIQEEAPYLNKPVVVLRNVTERVEGVKSGTLLLAGTNEESIYKKTSNIINDINLYNKIANSKNPFGDGNASKRIIKAIKHHFKLSDQSPEDYIID